MARLYYDSRTGNVRRFIDKVVRATGWQAVRLGADTEPDASGHLVTYTTKIGFVPEKTQEFMEKHGHLIRSVASSGNRNWGRNFGLAADTIAREYGVPLAMKFELSGTTEDIDRFIDIIKDKETEQETVKKIA